MDTNNNKKCLLYCYKILARKDYSVYSLKKKLKLKKFEDNEIIESINKIISDGFLNDEKYARYKIKQQLLKGNSASSVKEALAFEKINIDTEFINETITQFSLNPTDTLKTHVQKRFKLYLKKYPEDKLKREQKILSHFFQKGHSIELIKKMINEVSNEFLFDNESDLQP